MGGKTIDVGPICPVRCKLVYELQKQAANHVEGNVFLPFNHHRPAGGHKARTEEQEPGSQPCLH